MAFGDVLAGYGEAAFQNQQNLLQLEYGKRKAVADYMAKLGDDERFDEASRAAFHQEGINALTGDLSKPYKPPDFTKMQVQPPQAPTPPPLQNIGGAPGTPGTIQTPGVGGSPADSTIQAATAAINPRTVQLPQPAPPPEHPAMQVMNPTQIAQRQAPATQIGLQAKGVGEAAGEAAGIGIRKQALESLYPDMDPELSAFFATKMPMGAFLGTSNVPNVKGSDITLQQDAFGKPIDKNGLYTIKSNKMGQPLAAYPNNNPAVGGLHYYMDNQTGQWVEAWMDKTNNLHVMRNTGLTPPIGVPTQNIHYDKRAFVQPNGDINLVDVQTSGVRTRGGVPTPAAPGQPQAQPQQQTQPGAAAPAPPPVPGPLAGLMPSVTAPSAPPQAQAGQAPKAKAAGAAAGTASVPSGYLPSTAYAPSQAPSGGPGRKVGGRPLPPQQEITDEQKVGGYGTALERASDVLNLWDDIAGKEKGGINGFIERLKMQTVTHPDGTASIVATNISNLSEKEKKFASAYSSLGEDINILRTIYGTPVSRGPESLKILLDQKGPLLGDPDVSKQILQNTVKSMLSSVAPLYRGLRSHGSTAPLPEGVRAAYLALNGDDPVKATAQMKQDRWF